MIEFFVPGQPATQGSKTAFVNRFTGKANIVDSCKRNKPWRSDVKMIAMSEMKGRKPLTGPVCVNLVFFLLRPLSHLRGGHRDGELKATAPRHHIQKPDTVKLARAVEDALKGVCWLDDSQICIETISKHWHADAPGVSVQIKEVTI